MSNRHRRSRRSGDPADPAAETSSRRALLARLTGSPDLVQAVRRLSPGMLHGVIRACGLEDSAELLALATPEQLTAVLDLDLWRTDHPGHEEQLDAGRFCEWLEALAEAGADRAAETIARMDPALVTAALASEIAVFDLASGVVAHGLDREFGGYRVVARGTGSWDTIVTVLIALEETAPEVFHRVMRGCRRLSNSAPEIDGLDDLLGVSDQGMFQLAVDRETRRDAQGYVTPAQARAFLTSSRALRLDAGDVPARSAIVTAHLREPGMTIDSDTAPSAQTHDPQQSLASDDEDAAVSSVIAALVDAGALADRRQALLPASDRESLRFPHVATRLQRLFESDPALYPQYGQELAFLANVLLSGCSLQGRPFTPREASDAATATCNLGLEHWPAQWPEPADLTISFQVGVAVLHRDVAMRAAADLIDALTTLACSDRDVQLGLHALRRALTMHWRAGTPWGARDAMEVLAILDTPAWAALLGLIAEFPVMLANVSAAGSTRPLLSIDPTAFGFIADAAALACVRRFLERVPDALAR